MDFSIYKAYIFDFDYTLADATGGIVESYNRVFAEFGYPPRDRETIRATIGLSVIDSFLLMTDSDDHALAERFYASFIKAADEIMTANTEFLPGARELLTILGSRNIPCAVVTTKLAYRITDFFAVKDCPELIEFVIGYGDVKISKPDPEGINIACGRFADAHNIQKNEILYVGDNTVDAEAAVNAGVDFAGVLTGTTGRNELAEYPHVALFGRAGDIIAQL